MIRSQKATRTKGSTKKKNSQKGGGLYGRCFANVSLKEMKTHQDYVEDVKYYLNDKKLNCSKNFNNTFNNEIIKDGLGSGNINEELLRILRNNPQHIIDRDDEIVQGGELSVRQRDIVRDWILKNYVNEFEIYLKSRELTPEQIKNISGIFATKNIDEKVYTVYEFTHPRKIFDMKKYDKMIADIDSYIESQQTSQSSRRGGKMKTRKKSYKRRNKSIHR